MAAYPTELPIFELRSLMSIISSGDVMGQKAEFFKNLWWVQGYGQKLLFGENPQMIAASAAAEITSDEEAVAAIQKIIDSADSPSAQSLAPIWTALVSWAINKALEYLLK
jgi:hypothetical protein